MRPDREARLRSENGVRLASSGAADVVRYRVRRGDTLSEIAEPYRTTVEAITTANDLDDTVIQPGEEQLIPSGG